MIETTFSTAKCCKDHKYIYITAIILSDKRRIGTGKCVRLNFSFCPIVRDIAVVWYYDGTDSSFQVSLRTFHPNAPDVSVVAKKYGGGGHVRASGLKWRGATIESLFEPF